MAAWFPATLRRFSHSGSLGSRRRVVRAMALLGSVASASTPLGAIVVWGCLAARLVPRVGRVPLLRCVGVERGACTASHAARCRVEESSRWLAAFGVLGRDYRRDCSRPTACYRKIPKLAACKTLAIRSMASRTQSPTLGPKRHLCIVLRPQLSLCCKPASNVPHLCTHCC